MVRKSSKRPPIREKSGNRAGEYLHVLISDARLSRRVKQLAHEIRRDFPKDALHLVGVLKGSIFLLADLARELRGEVSFDFIGVSSYGTGTSTSGESTAYERPGREHRIENRSYRRRHFGYRLTLKYIQRLFEERKPKHLRTIVLLDKPERRIADVRADYTGFSIPNEFVVGYGLDYDQRYRNLPGVCILRLSSPKKTKTV